MNARARNTNQVSKVVIYVRISMARDNQTSLRTQESEARAYAAKNGWEVIEVATDDGISAYSGKERPGLNQAMRLIETGQANALLVWKLDRIARSITDFHDLMGRINRAGGTFASVTDNGLDGSTTVGQIMLGLVAGFAQMESDIKRDRTNAWQRDAIAKGSPGGALRAYGYTTQSNGTLSIIENEATIVREAAKRILNGESLKGIIRSLAPQSTRGGPMTNRGLRSALTNPTVAGLRRNGEGYAPGNWTPILDRSDWDELNTLFSNPDRRTGTSNQITHLLSGIMECGECGSTVGIRKWKANPTKRNPYVQESHRYTCQCGNSIDEANANRVVLARMWEIVTPSQWSDWKLTGNGWDAAVIEGIQARRENVLMQNVLGKISDAAADEMVKMLDHQESIATGDEPLDLPESTDIKRDWETVSIIDKRKVVNQAFETIKLNASNGTRNPELRITTS